MWAWVTPVRPRPSAGLGFSPGAWAQSTCRPCGSPGGSQTCSGCRRSRPRRTARVGWSGQGSKGGCQVAAAQRQLAIKTRTCRGTHMRQGTWRPCVDACVPLAPSRRQAQHVCQAVCNACVSQVRLRVDRLETHKSNGGATWRRRQSCTHRQALVLADVVIEARDAAAAGAHLLGQSAEVGLGPAGI